MPTGRRPWPGAHHQHLDRLPDALGQRHRLPGGARHQHDQLLAAEPGGDVGLALLVPDRRADLGEQRVAGRVAVAVVEVLEVVEVEHHQRAAAAVAAHAADLALQHVGEVRVRVQPGQPVGERLRGDRAPPRRRAARRGRTPPARRRRTRSAAACRAARGRRRTPPAPARGGRRPPPRTRHRPPPGPERRAVRWPRRTAPPPGTPARAPACRSGNVAVAPPGSPRRRCTSGVGRHLVCRYLRRGGLRAIPQPSESRADMTCKRYNDVALETGPGSGGTSWNEGSSSPHQGCSRRRSDRMSSRTIWPTRPTPASRARFSRRSPSATCCSRTPRPAPRSGRSAPAR